MSDKTTPDHPMAPSTPTWDECRAKNDADVFRLTALEQFIFENGPYKGSDEQYWNSLLSAAIAEIRKAERGRCAKYVMSECVQISGDGHLYRLSGAELAAGIIDLPEPPRSLPDQTAEESK